MKRKSPIRHPVTGHYREGKWVASFQRGKGTSPQKLRKAVVVGSKEPEPDYWNYWLDLDDLVQVIGKYKIGKIVETYPSRGEANVHWVHPITEVPTGTSSIIPLKDLRKVIEVSGASGRLVIIRDKEGNPIGHEKMNRYHVVVEDIDGETERVYGPVHLRRSPKRLRDLRRKYRT